MATLTNAVAVVTVGANVVESGVSIDITNEPNACAAIVNGGGFPQGATVLQLGVGSGTAALPGPGTYTINPSATMGPFAAAEYASVASGSCAELAHAGLVDSLGTIALTSVSTELVTGSFDVKFAQPYVQGQPPNFDHVTGTFSAAGCAYASQGASPLKCQVFSTQ